MLAPAPCSAPSSRSSCRTESTVAFWSCATRKAMTDAHAVIPPALASVVVRFTGRLTCEEIAREASAEVGADVPVDVVVRLADELAVGLFLEGPLFARRARPRRARVRRGPHARRPRTPAARTTESAPPSSATSRRRAWRRPTATDGAAHGSNGATGAMRALVAPHIDPWRGAVGYGHAYGALARRDPAGGRHVRALRHLARADARAVRPLPQGVRHAARRRAPADEEGIDALAARRRGLRPLRRSVQPQARALAGVPGRLPEAHAEASASFASSPSSRASARSRPAAAIPTATRAIVRVHRRRAHPSSSRAPAASSSSPAPTWRTWARASAIPAPSERRSEAALERADRESLDHATSLDARGFWKHVVADLEAAARVRPGAHLVAPADAGGRRRGRQGAPLRADGGRGRRVDREPRGGGVLWVGEAGRGPVHAVGAKGSVPPLDPPLDPLEGGQAEVAASLTCWIARATSGGRFGFRAAPGTFAGVTQW